MSEPIFAFSFNEQMSFSLLVLSLLKGRQIISKNLHYRKERIMITVIINIPRRRVEANELRYTTNSFSRSVSNIKEGIKRSIINPKPIPNKTITAVLFPDNKRRMVPIKIKTIPQCK